MNYMGPYGLSEIKPGLLYRLVSQTIEIRLHDGRYFTTISFGPDFLDGPLMYIGQTDRVAKCAMFLNANGTQLYVNCNTLTEAIKNQSHVQADDAST